MSDCNSAEIQMVKDIKRSVMGSYQQLDTMEDIAQIC